MHLTYRGEASESGADRPALTRAEELARVMAEELRRQEPGAMELSEGDLTEFIMFGPFNLFSLAESVLRACAPGTASE